MAQPELLVEVDIAVGDQIKRLEVERFGHPFDGPRYEVKINGEVKHVTGDPHGVIRALGHYIHSLTHRRAR